jgi:hypothetical protein
MKPKANRRQPAVKANSAFDRSSDSDGLLAVGWQSGGCYARPGLGQNGNHLLKWRQGG